MLEMSARLDWRDVVWALVDSGFNVSISGEDGHVVATSDDVRVTFRPNAIIAAGVFSVSVAGEHKVCGLAVSMREVSTLLAEALL